jgi:hypothetical protein
VTDWRWSGGRGWIRRHGSTVDVRSRITHKKLPYKLPFENPIHDPQYKNPAHHTAFLESKGFRLLRFWDHEVLTDLEAVLQKIFDSIEHDQ